MRTAKLWQSKSKQEVAIVPVKNRSSEELDAIPIALQTEEEKTEIKRRYYKQLVFELMTQINVLIEAQKAEKPLWYRDYRHEDPKSVHYHSMLKRIGLPEKHARFAPWFYKSKKIKLNSWSQKLFEDIEEDYELSMHGRSDGQVALEAYDKFVNILKLHDLEPHQLNQLMLQKAFRDCTMTVKEIDLQHRQKTDAIHFAFRPQDPEKDIPMKPVGAAPPGLATPISGQLESHGNHVYFNYTGRWKNGHMRGPMGVYLFADGGKYVGTWKDSLQCGSGVAEYPNGARYSGQWKDGHYHGYGVLEFTTGSKYEGHWREGERHGKGKIILADGSTYDGSFFNGKREGAGTAMSSKGYRYSGHWCRNRIQGAGVVVLLDGTRINQENWGPCVLGDAILQALDIHEDNLQSERRHMAKLYRVRDDLRALDLQFAYRDRIEREANEAKRLDKARRKRLRREKKEAERKRRADYLGSLPEDEYSDSSDDSNDSDEFSDDSSSESEQSLQEEDAPDSDLESIE